MIDPQTAYVVSVTFSSLVYGLILMRIVMHIIDRVIPRGTPKDQ